MNEPHSEKLPLISRRKALFAGAIGALKVAFSGEPVRAAPSELQKSDEKPIPVERWTSEVRQTLASLIRPLADEHEKTSHQLLDLVFPFLISNSAVVTNEGNELLVKCYINGPKSGEDLGDNIQANEKRRVYEVFMVLNPDKPNKSGLIINTTQEQPPVDESNNKDFDTKKYPFNFAVSFYTSGITVMINNSEQILPEDAQEMFGTMFLDLFDGEIIAPPTQLKEESKKFLT